MPEALISFIFASLHIKKIHKIQNNQSYKHGQNA